jgi:hypothetical protein
MAPRIGDPSQSGLHAFPLAVQCDVGVNDGVIEPLSWCEGEKGSAGDGYGANLAHLVGHCSVLGIRRLQCRLDELPFI